MIWHITHTCNIHYGIINTPYNIPLDYHLLPAENIGSSTKTEMKTVEKLSHKIYPTRDTRGLHLLIPIRIYS